MRVRKNSYLGGPVGGRIITRGTNDDNFGGKVCCGHLQDVTEKGVHAIKCSYGF